MSIGVSFDHGSRGLQIYQDLEAEADAEQPASEEFRASSKAGCVSESAQLGMLTRALSSGAEI